MAISGVSGAGASYREQYEANGGIYGTDETDETESGSGTEKIWNAVFTDKKTNGVSVDDFLSLMVAQMTNQDFMNPMDDTQFVTQLAQFSSMQMMQEMANYTKTGYVMSLVGKPVTAARISVSGELIKETGVVQKVTLTNNEFAVYVNGKRFTLEQLMEIGVTGAVEDTSGTTDTTLTEDQLAQRRERLNFLLGREVTISVKDEDGDEYEVFGVVEKVSTKDGKFRIYVNDEWYDMDDVTEVGGLVNKSGSAEEEELPKVEDTESSGSTQAPEVTEPEEETPPVETVPEDIETDSAEETEESDPDSEEITPAEETQEV